MTTANFAANTYGTKGVIEPIYVSSKWYGRFVTKEGPVFYHLPEALLITHERAFSPPNVLSDTKFSFSPTSGIDDWTPLCALNLEREMTAEQFFDELKRATQIIKTQPPELAEFLKK
jgi:hypothetical protein